MSASRVALILGSGPGVGTSVAKKFASNGYKVAVVSRRGSNTLTPEGYLSLKADFTKPDSIPEVFNATKSKFHAAPSVVVYNAAALTPPAKDSSIFSIPIDSFTSDLNINTISAYAAAQQAVSGWETLPKETKKTFIYTGNGLNVLVLPVPMMATLGVGKSASASWVGLADALYSSQGSRFFYADERKEDGSVKGMEIDGDAHAEFYAQLAAHDGNVPWDATFVKNKGYVNFKA